MTKFRQAALFGLIVLPLSPVVLLGGTLLYLHVAFALLLQLLRGKRFSLTAYDPMFARWMLHAQGKRPDAAASELLYALPGMSRLTVALAINPVLWALRLSGYAIHMYDYPVYESSNVIDALGHRTRFFDDAIANTLGEVSQLVLLGAGWDTRAYHHNHREGLRVFEVDAPDTQTQKRAAIERARVDVTGVTFVTADFNRESWLEALTEAGFDSNQPTFILWEGVTPYLEPDAVRATLRTVADTLPAGSAIAFEYYALHLVEGTGTGYSRLIAPAARMVGEPWLFGLPCTPAAEQHVAEFLAQNGGLLLTAYERIGNGEITEPCDGGLVLARKE
ncbi:MAG: class I SAM-dependent methyltransferase [Halioglobus sp.]|nr:class I SAM-dependent methyltransferase [Halioglobus sp.]